MASILGPLLFTGTLLLGAAVGVFVDRLWRKIESRTKLKVGIGYYQRGLCGPLEHLKDPRRWEGGLSVRIHNVGRSPIPPYRVAIYHPSHGSLYPFWTAHVGQLLPGQMDEQFAVLTTDGKFNFDLLSWLGPDELETVEGYVLRVEMDRSESIIFEEPEYGKWFIGMCECAKKAKDLSRAGRWLNSPSVYNKYIRTQQSGRVRRLLSAWCSAAKQRADSRQFSCAIKPMREPKPSEIFPQQAALAPPR